MGTQVATPAAYKLLHTGSLVLAEMEANGIRIDIDYLDRTIAETGRRIQDLKQQLKAEPLWAKWRQRFKARANLGSRPQLAELLFDGEQLPYPHERTATGKYRMDDEVLRGIELPFVGAYMQLADLEKMKGTFLEGIRRETVDGYLHPVFNLHTVETYRSSSSDINFQNLPTRDAEMGQAVRQCFIPRKGRVLVEVDYVGIEVRVAACYHQDPVMLEYIQDPTKDMHRDSAAQLYMVEPEQVTKQMRYCAKNQFVFPQFYGSYFAQCAPNLWDSIDRYKLAIEGGGTKPMSRIRNDMHEHPVSVGGPIPLKKHLKSKGIRGLGSIEGLKGKPTNGRIATQPSTFLEHVRQVEEDFWGNRFKVYHQWKQDWYARYLKEGSFGMLTGFCCTGTYRRNEVLNYSVQGSAFHCLLWSAIRIQRLLAKRQMRTKLVGQIHDSLLADVPIIEVQDYLDLARQVMVKDLPKAWDWICVPLDIECEVAEVDWFGKEAWVEQEGVWAPKT